tara:strand:+ start:2463 stop:2720 length:258 start_codon:yes stop_codon:yes gene_type:complete
MNSKLDKTDRLTKALKLARPAKDKGISLMVGLVTRTSLAIPPTYAIAQLCDFIELDGPLFLAPDRTHPISYKQGVVQGLTPKLWG